MSVAERLLSKIEPLDNGCWKYLGGINQAGYGNIWDNGRTRSAHIVSFEIHNRPVSKGLNVLHTCDNRWCVNPEHLFEGTTQDNIDDMISKGRDGFKGAKNGRAILNEEQVEAIRKFLTTTTYSQQYIADKFGVSRSTVAAIKAGRLWK